MTARAMKCIKSAAHPNADALRVYEFNHEDTTLQIVANMENVYEIGDVVIIVESGSTLLDGTNIKTASLRGVKSQGMALGKTNVPVGTDLTKEHCQPEVVSNDISHIPWPDIGSLYNIRKYLVQNNIARKVKYRAKVKLDGCFHRRTKITMWDGSRKLITQVEPGEYVLGVNPQGDIVKSKVLNKFNNGNTNNWILVKGHRTANESGCTSGVFSIQCTPNHLFWDENKKEYVEARLLKAGDEILYNRKREISLSFTQKQILLGKLLGDATLMEIESSAHVTWQHSEKDKEYIEWTNSALGELVLLKNNEYISGYGSKMLRNRTMNSAHIKHEFGSLYIGDKGNRKKVISDWVSNELYPLSIAFWYMDDGSLSHDESQRDRASFHTQNFTVRDCEILLKGLEKFGITGSTNNDGKSRDKNYPVIHLDTDSSEKLFSLISPYIPPCMQRKLPKHYRGQPGFYPKTDNFYEPSVCKRKIISVEKVFSKDKKHDLETSTHNYFANGVLVHNSNGGIQLPPSDSTISKKVIPQSRSRIINVENDNMGFARSVVTNYATYLKIRENADALGIKEHLTIFGEFAGAGIQKRTAISRIEKQIFAVFAVQIGLRDNAKFETDPERLGRIIFGTSDGKRPEGDAKWETIHILPWEGDIQELDYSNADRLAYDADIINQKVEAVENCDPWVKETFGVEGLGEGVVMYPILNENTLIDRADYTDLVFKAKGEKHKVVNAKKPAQIDPEFVATIDDFVELMVTENRLEQIAQKVGEFHKKNIGIFMKELSQDVHKESEAELEESNLEWRQVAKAVGDKARKWFMAKCEEL